MKVFFSGGLPKSGSNMIKNVLSQNKKIAIHPYSPIVDSLNIIKSTLFNQETLRNRKKDSFEECIKQFFNHGMVGWANGLNKKASVYIDDNRNWLGNLQDLENIFNGKMIVFIKDLKSIINSLEYIYKNKVDYNTIFTNDFYQYQPNNKQLQRVIKFFNGEGMKITLNGIHRIIEEKNKNNYFCMKYILILGIIYQYYKKPAVITVKANNRYIDQFSLDKDAPKSTLKKLRTHIKHEHLKKLDHWMNNRVPSIFVEKFLNDEDGVFYHWPNMIKTFEIDEEYLTGDLKIEVENANSNYTNGFMTKSSLVKFAYVGLIPKDFFKTILKN